MKEIKGNILKTINDYDLICFTANSNIKKDGSLVMGRGNALSFKKKFKNIDRFFGEKVTNRELFGLKVLKGTKDVKIGAFQTKINWNENSTYEILEYSIEKLLDYKKAFPEEKIAICYPGVENGKLDKDTVKEMFTDIDVDLFYL